MSLYLRISEILAFDKCPRSWYYQYQEKIKSDVTPANLVFGTTGHDIIEKIVRAQFEGKGPIDAADEFVSQWREATKKQIIAYNSVFGPDDLEATGAKLISQFERDWPTLGLEPVVNENGEPVIEERLYTQIADGVFLTGKPDLLCMDEEGRVLLTDWKFVGNPSQDVFVHQSDQLTGYCLLARENADYLGIDKLDAVTFFEGVKRKVSGRKGPEWHQTPRTSRTDRQIQELYDKIRWIAEDIAKQRFPKRSLAAYNSPCMMCDYSAYCTSGDTDGLILPQQDALQMTA